MENDILKKYLSELTDKVESVEKTAVPQRNLSKQPYSFSGKPLPEQLEIWSYIWKNAPGFWVQIQAYLLFEAHLKNKTFLIGSWKTIKLWQKYVDSWGTCDGLSKIYTKVLEIIPDKVLNQLKLWNQSNNIWDKRQSVVSLLYFSRTKKVFLPYPTIIPFIDRLLTDPEHFVQKGVGWSLKELYNVYPTETLQYLNENITKIPAKVFSIATEKLKKADKEILKTKRKP